MIGGMDLGLCLDSVDMFPTLIYVWLVLEIHG